MPGVLLDTQTIGSPFDRRHHHHHHSFFHDSPTISSVISAGSCSISNTPPATSSSSAPHIPASPDSHSTFRFGDLPPHTLTPSSPPGFFLQPPRVAGCFSRPAPFDCPSFDELSSSSFSRPVDLPAEVDENARCGSLPKHGSSGLIPVCERGEFDVSQLTTEDGDDGAVVKSLEASSGCDSEGNRVADVEMGAAAAGNYGSSIAGACMVGSPVYPDAMSALQRFLPSNNDDDDELWPMGSWPAMDVYSCDDFRMYEFKVRRCMRGRSHDWTECPFAHPGEKARRRDPRKFHYSGTACPDFRKGSCKRGEACEYAHGVFECWLHPARYRTQPCKDGRSCRRRVCFFAHTNEQLRVLPAGGAAGSPPASLATSPASSARSSVLKAALSGGAYDGSPLRQALAGSLDGALALELLYEQGRCKATTSHSGCAAGLSCFPATPSPTSTLLGHHALSPPASPSSSSSSPPLSPNSLSSAWPRSPGSLSSTSTHRSHLERLHSLPTSSIPTFDDRNLVQLSLSSESHPPRSMNELISSLQQLHLARATEPCRMAAFPWSFSHHPPRSVPGTPKSRYACKDDRRQAVDEALSQRAESGSNSTEKVSGISANEASVETDVPDFDWVNELVE